MKHFAATVAVFTASHFVVAIAAAADAPAPAAAPPVKAVEGTGYSATPVVTPTANEATKASSAAAPAAAAAPAKSIPGPTINAAVTEWVVFVADVSNPDLNGRSLFPDNLPPLVDDLRASRPVVPVRAYNSPYGVPASTSPDDSDAGHVERPKPGDPMPIGVIRFSAAGPLEKDAAVDVQLSYKNGRALGHWPRAKVRSSGLLWQDLHLGETKSEPRKLPEGSWLQSLRSGGLPLASGSTRESFLLYDVEVNYPLAMRVTGGKDGKYSVAQGMDAPLRDFTLYKRAADGHWQTASISSLAKSAGVAASATAAGTAKADGSPADAISGAINSIAGAFRVAKVAAPAVAAPVAAPAAVGGATAKTATPKEESPKPAAAIPASVKGTDVALSAPAQSDATVLESWRAKLADAGVAADDQEIVLKALARQALDPKRLTAIFRMDPAELDRILPLEVVPQPKKVSRIALVVVKGIDPAIGDELDGWVKKLGDPSWKTREAAMAAIKKAGVQAKSRLLQAAKSSDTEVAYRAEQLLSAIGVEPEQNAPTAPGAGAVLQMGGFF